jgi:hypothetical protein
VPFQIRLHVSIVLNSDHMPVLMHIGDEANGASSNITCSRGQNQNCHDRLNSNSGRAATKKTLPQQIVDLIRPKNRARRLAFRTGDSATFRPDGKTRHSFLSQSPGRIPNFPKIIAPSVSCQALKKFSKIGQSSQLHPSS